MKILWKYIQNYNELRVPFKYYTSDGKYNVYQAPLIQIWLA